MDTKKLFASPETRFAKARRVCRQFPTLRTLILVDASKGYIPDLRPESECGFIINLGAAFHEVPRHTRQEVFSELAEAMMDAFDCDVMMFDIDENDRPSEIEYINRDKVVVYDAQKHKARPRKGQT